MEMEKLFCVQFYITNSKLVYYQFVVESNFELATQEVIDNLKNDNVFNYHHLRTFVVLVDGKQRSNISDLINFS